MGKGIIIATKKCYQALPSRTWQREKKKIHENSQVNGIDPQATNNLLLLLISLKTQVAQNNPTTQNLDDRIQRPFV